MKRKDFQQLATLRLKEAKVLLDGHCWEGAYYLGGYVVECALKACIAKQTERFDFPDKKRAGLAELEAKLEGIDRTDPELNENWGIVRDWWEQSRYERPTQVEAENLINAIDDRKHGVLRWLRQHW